MEVGEPVYDENLASRQDIDEADIILISPFDHEAHKQAQAFQRRVIMPAIEQAGAELGKKIHVVPLNRRLAGADADLEMAYRAMHLAELCIADVTDYDHRALSYLSMRLVLSKGPAIAIDRNQYYKRSNYPAPVADLVLYAGEDPSQEADIQGRVKAIVLDAMQRSDSTLSTSPVFRELEALSVSLRGSRRREHMAPQYHFYSLNGVKKGPRIALAVGDIRQVRDVDVWVNPENTDLEMARVFDTSISGTIRHLSANWSGDRKRNDDFMRRQVAQKLPPSPVPAGFVDLTAPSGDLKRVNRAFAVAHVAAVKIDTQRGPGAGYEAVRGDQIRDCVRGVLRAMDTRNRAPFQKPLKSVIIPLIGSYASPRRAEENVMHMVEALSEYFSDPGVETGIKAVALLGYTDEDERLIRKAFSKAQGRDGQLLLNPTHQTSTSLAMENGRAG